MGAITRHFRALILQTLMFAAFLLCAPSLANAQDATSGLVGHWKLDETTGSSIADSAGSNTGTWSDGTGNSVAEETTPGKIRTAIDFDGADDVINAGSDTSIDDIFVGGGTVSAWIYPRSAGEGDFGSIFRKSPSINNDGWGWSMGGWFGSSDESMNFYSGCTTSGTLQWYTASGSVPYNQWHHVAVTFDQSSISNDPTYYINGVAVSSTETGTCSGAFDSDASENLRIGDLIAVDRAFDGLLDDLRIYDRILSAADIAVLASSFPGPVTCNAAYEAVMWYNHDESVMQYCDGTNWIDMGPRRYSPNTVSFDGTNDHLIHSTALTGAADSKTLTGSLWVRRNGGLGGAYNLVYSGGGSIGLRVTFDVSDRLRILGYNSGGTGILDYISTSSITDSNWHHIAFSVDLTNAANRHVYLDDAPLAGTWGTYTDDFLNLSGATTAIGWNGATLFPGDMADIWVDYGTYIDLSIASNRAKFIDANGNPAPLGGSGEGPTGGTPDIFLSGDTANWHTNKGSGGGFTENGALTNASPIIIGGTCTSPAGVAGEVDYNFDDGTMQYCNGADWISMGPKIAGAGGTGFTYTALTANIAHWELNETGNTSTAADSAGSNTGTLTNFPADPTANWVSGQDAGALDFDGSDDIINAGGALDISSGSFTVAGWLRRDTSGTHDFMFTTGTAAGNNLLHIGYRNTDVFTCAFFSNDLNTITTYTDTNWHHWACTYDAGTNARTLYRDGVVVLSDTSGSDFVGTGTTYLGDCPQCGGGCGGGSGCRFDGTIDDVRVYSSALTAQEVYNLYRATGGTDTGLVHHWELNETATGPAVDSGSGASNGTMTGGLDAATDSTTGKLGTALTFNGTSDYIDTNTSLDFPNGGVTISGWAKTTNTGGQRLFSKFGSGGNQKWLLVNAASDTVECGFHDGTGGVAALITTATTIADGNWHFYACSVTGSDVFAYYDGVQGATVGHDGTLSTNGSNWEIGRISTGGEYWNGDIDDVRIYNRALTAAEVIDLFESGGGSNAPAGCSNVGDVCSDGTVYAGSYNGNRTYVTTSDNSSGIAWSIEQVDTGADDTTDGEVNQAWVVANKTLADYPAFELCENLVAHGHTDWHLPSSGAVTALYVNRAAIGGFSTNLYLSSTEWDDNNARTRNFNTGGLINDSKTNLNHVRCVRLGASPPGGTCSNPSGPAGELIYNDDNNIMQYCNGSEWVGIR